MAVIANMDIVLGARTSKLDTALEQTTSRVKTFEGNMGGLATQANALTEAIAGIAGGWANSLPLFSSALSIARAVASSFEAIAQARTAKLAVDAAATAVSFKAAAGEVSQMAATTPIVAAEMQVVATQAEVFARAMALAAIASRTMSMPKLTSGARGGGLTLYNPSMARSGAMGAAKEAGDVIDAEFSVISNRAAANAAKVVPQAATTAISSIGTVGIAAGAAAAAAFVAVGAAVMGTVATISQMREQMDVIDNISDSANKLGTSFAELTTLRYGLGQASGLDDGAIDNALSKMTIGLVEAKNGGGALKETLDRMGLDAGKLLEAGPLEALKQISAKTQGMKNDGDQLAFAYELFGKQGAALVSALREGPEAMDEMEKRVAALGLTLTDTQANMVGKANDSWQDVQAAATGVFRTLAAEFSPLVTVFSKEILAVGDGFKGWGDYIPPIVDGFAYLAGFTYDWYQVLMASGRVFASIASGDFQNIGKIISQTLDFSSADRFLKGVQDARRAAAIEANVKPPATEADLSAIEARKQMLTQQGTLQQANQDAATRAANEQQAAYQRLQDSINGRIRSLREEVEVLRFGAAAARDMQLAREGANPAQRQAIAVLEQQKQSLERWQAMTEDAKQIREKFAPPIDQLKAELAKLEQMRQAGQLDPRTFELAATDAAKRLLPSKQPQSAPPSIGAFQRGSVEAFSAARRNSLNSSEGRTEKLQGESVAVLRAILSQLRAGPQVRVVGG